MRLRIKNPLKGKLGYVVHRVPEERRYDRTAKLQSDSGVTSGQGLVVAKADLSKGGTQPASRLLRHHLSTVGETSFPANRLDS